MCWKKRIFLLLPVLVHIHLVFLSSASHSHFTVSLGLIFLGSIILIESMGGCGEFNSYRQLLENINIFFGSFIVMCTYLLASQPLTSGFRFFWGEK